MKNEKYLIMEKHVETSNFREKKSSLLQSTKIYKIDRGYCIELLWEIYEKISHSDPIHVTRLSHLIRFSQVPQYSMISFFNNWWGRQNLLLALHGILPKPVKFIKWKYMTNLCPYGCCYNAWPTQCNHYDDVIMSTIASQITSLTIV